MALALLVIFVVLFASFGSVGQALLIILNVPTTLIGGHPGAVGRGRDHQRVVHDRADRPVRRLRAERHHPGRQDQRPQAKRAGPARRHRGGLAREVQGDLHDRPGHDRGRAAARPDRHDRRRTAPARWRSSTSAGSCSRWCCGASSCPRSTRSSPGSSGSTVARRWRSPEVAHGDQMGSRMDIEHALRIDELRAGFLKYTREAYALLPELARPRILDIGCGSGLSTIELARLSGGEVVGIDPDLCALARLQQRIARVGLGHRVKAIGASLGDTALADESFDVLWEEGVLHLLDPARSLPACHRLLRPGGSWSWARPSPGPRGNRGTDRGPRVQASPTGCSCRTLLVDRLLRAARGSHRGASCAR